MGKKRIPRRKRQFDMRTKEGKQWHTALRLRSFIVGVERELNTLRELLKELERK